MFSKNTLAKWDQSYNLECCPKTASPGEFSHRQGRVDREASQCLRCTTPLRGNLGRGSGLKIAIVVLSELLLLLLLLMLMLMLLLPAA